MVAAPSSVATRLIDTAPRPSVVATCTPAATMRSRVSPGFGPLPGRARRPQAAARTAGISLSIDSDPTSAYNLRSRAYVIRRRSREGAMSPAIEATGLTKSYGKLDVLTGVDLAVPAGTVFSLLGPNGAGKTTTVRILATLL